MSCCGSPFVPPGNGDDAGGGSSPVVISEQITYADDFLSDRLSFLSVAGGGTNGGGGSDMGNNHPGTYTQTVTAAGVDAARIVAARAAGTAAAIFFGGGLVTWQTSHQIPTRSNGVDNIVVRVGMHDANTINDATDGVYLEYDFATHGNHNYWLCAANNSARTKVDTNIAVTAGANRRIVIVVNAAGTLVTAAIDGVASSNTVAANIPVTAARNTYAGNLQAFKQLGAGALTVIHDYYSFNQVFTTPR
jgi:hypothetical protein